MAAGCPLLTDLFCAAALALCAGVAVLLLADLYLIAVHLGTAHGAIASERAALRAPLPAPDSASVCVQLPVFNETQVADAIDSLCGLIWPHGRLEILVLDDSTDDTREVAAARVALWQSRGIDIRHCPRTHRRDYKAGALADAFGLSQRALHRDLRCRLSPRAGFPGRGHASAARPAARGVRAGPPRLSQSRPQPADARAGDGAGCLFRLRAGGARLGRDPDAVQRHRRGLAPRRDRGSGRLARGLADRGSRSQPARLRQGLDRDQPRDGTRWLANCRRRARRWCRSGGAGRWARDSHRARCSWGLLRNLRLDRAVVLCLLSLQHATLAILLLAALAAAVASGTTAALAVFAITLALVVGLKSAGAALAQRTLGRHLSLVDLAAMWLMEAMLLPIRAKALVQGLVSRRHEPFVRTPKKG